MRAPLHVKILIGAGLGAAFGVAAYLFLGAESRELKGFIRYVTQPVGQIFLRLLFMTIAPLLFAALALGVAGLGDLRRIGRVGVKTLAYTVVVSGIAVLLGVALVNLVRPGDGISEEARAKLTAGAAERAATITTGAPARSGVDFLVNIVPDNPVKAVAQGDYLALMFFALVFGIGLAVVTTPAARRLTEVLEGLYDVMMRVIRMIIGLAPIGVFALLFTLTAQLGYEVLGHLLQFVFVVLLALAIHQFVVFSLSVRLLGGMSPVRFFRGIREAIVTAFSTSSSNATLPVALRVAEENLKLPPQVSRFVLTLGSTANQNGTALYEGVTVLFLAQFYGVELSFAQQVVVVGMCVLGGIGTAGVPSGSLPMIAIILGMVNVPPEGIGLILGVDRLLDMCRTTLNVTGDLAAAVVVSRGEEAIPGASIAPGAAVAPAPPVTNEEPIASEDS